MPLDAEQRRARGRLAANTRHHPDKPELTADDAFEFKRERIKRIVDGWPPLTPEQRERLALLLRPCGDGDATA